MTTPHKHAEIIRAIADGLEVQFLSASNKDWVTWEPSHSASPLNYTWADLKWRIKPRMIVCGKHSWPEPMREAPEDGCIFYIASPSWSVIPVNHFVWRGNRSDRIPLQRGMCHTTHEAAEQHARALIAISQGDV